MDETQKSSYLSLGIFLKLLSRYTRKDKAIAEKRFLGANNTVISTTIFKYFISALTLNWYTDDNERSDTLKSLNSNLINCKKELFNFKFLMPEKDEIKAVFIKDVQSDTQTALAFMTEFVLYCIDENKCRQMVDELLRAIRDDKDIADDTAFYIFGNGKSATKSEMVDKRFNFTADCFLLGVWHFLIRERSESNRIGRDTLVDWYGTSTETYGKSQIGTELRRNVWEPLGREIRVIPSERKVLKEEKAVSQDNAEQEHKLFVYDMDSLSEEEKEGDFVNEDSFVFAEIKKALKSDSIEPETKEKLKSVAALNTEEKALKSAIKTESALLEEKTKDTIEGLSDEQVIELLKEKWIKPLIDNLMQLPDSIVAELVAKLETLAKKYETTFAEVETQIEETEKSLSAMIDDLDGSEFDMLGLAELKKLLGGCAK